jgi:hypothetical protein
MNEHDKKVIKTMARIITNLKKLELLLPQARDIYKDIEEYQEWRQMYILESEEQQ